MTRRVCTCCHGGPAKVDISPAWRDPVCTCCAQSVCQCGEIVLARPDGYPQSCRFMGVRHVHAESGGRCGAA